MRQTHLLLLLLLGLLLSACPPVSGGDDDDDDDSAAADDDDDDDGWVELQDGLDVHDVVIGDGAVVEIGDTITAHYTLWLWEDDELGTQLETSRPNNPFSAGIGVGQLIQGWDLGIPGMRVGGQRELLIGPALAYGAGGQGSVPPNATLFFEVEILSVP